MIRDWRLVKRAGDIGTGGAADAPGVQVMVEECGEVGGVPRGTFAKSGKYRTYVKKSGKE